MEKKNKSTELRSEKVRNIIGQVPSVLIRNGTLIICVVLVVMLTISVFVPYREIIPIQIKVETSPKACFVHATVNGFFVSDSVPTSINADSIIGHIINEDFIEKIISPIKGDVLMNINNEEQINKGELLCAIIPKNHTCYGIAEISAEDYYKIKEGNKILMTLDKDIAIEGIVEQISSLSPNKNRHKVKINFEKNTLQEKLIVGTIHKGKVILYDMPILKKLFSSVGIKII
ncbi:MAG: hypothetical protein H6Q13_2717 [Bacteroidetes bacterium]|jgi:hypothetical protein|nr:hypothetical protein [Bacteroidota bacterium]